jgi:hypothetical protein
MKRETRLSIRAGKNPVVLLFWSKFIACRETVPSFFAAINPFSVQPVGGHPEGTAKYNLVQRIKSILR